MKLFFSHLLASLFITAIGIALYDRLVFRPAQHIGVVDIGEVYRAKEAQFAQLLTKSASEADRAKALEMAKQFAKQLPIALEELPKECRCLVVAKASVIGSPANMIDLTALLKRKVELPS
jgi:hypothetical protein